MAYALKTNKVTGKTEEKLVWTKVNIGTLPDNLQKLVQVRHALAMQLRKADAAAEKVAKELLVKSSYNEEGVEPLISWRFGTDEAPNMSFAFDNKAPKKGAKASRGGVALS